jgi:hypothetical protein
VVRTRQRRGGWVSLGRDTGGGGARSTKGLGEIVATPGLTSHFLNLTPQLAPRFAHLTPETHFYGVRGANANTGLV